jgi:hypothetical protein
MKARYWMQLAAVASSMAISGMAVAVDAGPTVGKMQQNPSPDAATSKSGAVNARGESSHSAALPARADNADDAWTKLGNKGYITKDDVKGLQGFSFDAADTNHDGQLTQDEFRAAWSTHRAPTQSSGSRPMTNSGSPSAGMARSGSSSGSNSASGVTTAPK